MRILTIYRSIGGDQGGPEECFYIQVAAPLTTEQGDLLRWLLQSPQVELSDSSAYKSGSALEIGPRLSIETPFSSNAVAICRSMGIPAERFERSVRYPKTIPEAELLRVAGFDRMTQEIYESQPLSLQSSRVPEPVRLVDVLGEGERALKSANEEYGFGMDARDISYYAELFRTTLGRNPTIVECFQLANANSDHSRHWIFRGKIVIDGVAMERSLIELIQAPWKARPGISIAAFDDNAGASWGAKTTLLFPAMPGAVSSIRSVERMIHTTGTAETHNHPTLVEPYAGAATGGGGRIRDSRAVGRGALHHAGFIGYSVGSLNMPGHAIPGDAAAALSHSYASPIDILIQGSNGAAHYGNCIGEPLIGGFVRSFDGLLGGKRIAYGKPILYSAGVGFIPDRSVKKEAPEVGMRIVAIGGPAYPIGVGGGAASSMGAGTNSTELDFKSVQRGNPEMENRVNRVIQVCVELGERNPIQSIHDQGAGGPSNVLTELMEPLGGVVNLRRIVCGDTAMSAVEIWVAEFQERYGILVKPDGLNVLRAICEREGVSLEDLGEVTGSGRVVVEDSDAGTNVVDLPLDGVLSGMPMKVFDTSRVPREFKPFVLPEGITVRDALFGVLLRPEVGSKGYLVHKGDRSVTGCVAQQQCCGPMQIPVADVAVLAASMDDTFGVATALGEQPIKGLIDAAASARMSLAEAVTNIAPAYIHDLAAIRFRVNWMWPAKESGELARLYDANQAVSDLMIALGVAADGGKDSCSMTVATKEGVVASPGTVVIQARAAMKDIRKVVTPDFEGGGTIGFIDLGCGKNRLGASALAVSLEQLGDETPDIDDAPLLARAFAAIQELIEKDLITAYHDRSDGGLITTIAEMCMAGNCGAQVKVDAAQDAIRSLFNEEAGMVFEYHDPRVHHILSAHDVPYTDIGTTDAGAVRITIAHGKEVVFNETITDVRVQWEATSIALDAIQANPATVVQEKEMHADPRPHHHHLSFNPAPTPQLRQKPIAVAVIRAPGSNGEREMASACILAGLDAYDVNMHDLEKGDADLDQFRAVYFPGGFSFGDTLGSAKGWAGTILANPRLAEMFMRFRDRTDTLSLGVCNGCQLETLLGWTNPVGVADDIRPLLTHNVSRRFESRWSTVLIEQSPAVHLQGMVGSRMGVWVAHGEGRFYSPDPRVLIRMERNGLVPITYVEPDGEATEMYPYNPNGSPFGIAALCSEDGRHLAMMPHPERAVLPWQLPHVPTQWRGHKAGPWLKLFQNMQTWLSQS